MKKVIRSIIDIREGELKVTLLLLANIYIILLTYYFLKPARDSLFLVKLGAEQLPYVFILTALIIVPITTLYSKASRSLKLKWLINNTLIILIISLFGLRFLMTFPYDWIPYIFYAWVSIFGALVTSQFWLLANHVYTATQAKRLFALLGLGGIFGAWSGGEATNLMIQLLDVSTENLLIFCAGFMLISIYLTTVICNVKKKEIEEQSRLSKNRSLRKESLFQTVLTIKNSRHLLLIVGILSITMVVASLVDFQFKAVSTESFTDVTTGLVDKAGLTAFLGTFYGRLSLVSIILQLVIANKILKVMGVGSIILFLPIGLLLGSVAMFAYVSLLSAVLLRGADGAIKNSLDKTGRELLFLPIPPELKKRTKVFIDMFVDRLSRGMAGALLLLLINIFNYELNPSYAISMMSLVVIALILIWIVFTFLMRKEYVNTFRTAIANREINLSEIRQQINESSTIEILIASLRSKNQKEICYALDMLEGVENEQLFEPLHVLLSHESDEVIERALKLLKPYNTKLDMIHIEKFLSSNNYEIRIEAMHHIILQNPDESYEMINKYLFHQDATYQVIAFSCIAKYGDSSQKNTITSEFISNLIDDKSSNRNEILFHTARALGKLSNPEYSKYFNILLDDKSSRIVNEAIVSIRYIKKIEYADWLITALADRRYRVESRKTLAGFGEDIIEKLRDCLADTNCKWEIQKHIPGVISLIYEQVSIDVLINSLSNAPSKLHYYIIKSLNKLRVQCPDLNYYPEILDEIVITGTKRYFELTQILEVQDNSDAPENLLLKRGLQEKLDETKEQIFRLLGLYYPSKDIYNAYQEVVSDSTVRRASAVEFLDNVIKRDVRIFLIPIVDESNNKKLVRQGRELFKMKVLNLEESYYSMMNSNDDWLRVLAIFNARNLNSNRLSETVKGFLGNSSYVIRETAEFYFKK